MPHIFNTSSEQQHALWRPAGKDNKVIINDLGSWPCLKGMYFLGCATLRLNVKTAYTGDPQHFSSTWWLGDPVKLWVQTKYFYNGCATLSLSVHYDVKSYLMKESKTPCVFLHSGLMLGGNGTGHNQSSCSPWTMITGQLIMNRMSENWPHVGTWRTVDSNYICIAKRNTLLYSWCFISHGFLVPHLLSANQCSVRIIKSWYG